jgi:hypothetical protein
MRMTSCSRIPKQFARVPETGTSLKMAKDKNQTLIITSPVCVCVGQYFLEAEASRCCQSWAGSALLLRESY